MEYSALKGSVRALLDEYKKAIDELAGIIRPIDNEFLNKVVDADTTDEDCRSIQTVLTHVVYAGYGYTNSMEKLLGSDRPRPPKEPYNNTEQFITGLYEMYSNCKNFFLKNPSITMEETDPAKKMTVSWGQQYDVEQLMEHAIVHILRHRRQIRKFIHIQQGTGNSLDRNQPDC